MSTEPHEPPEDIEDIELTPEQEKRIRMAEIKEECDRTGELYPEELQEYILDIIDPDRERNGP